MLLLRISSLAKALFYRMSPSLFVGEDPSGTPTPLDLI
jgi:hypothetical protein